jgi:alkylation response protein AidB-like acyl-CoA dehydrogenase
MADQRLFKATNDMTLIDRPTLDFLLYNWLGAETLFDRPAFAAHSRESVAAMLDTADKLAASHFLPSFRKADREEPFQDAEGAHVIPEIRAAIAAYAQAGFAAAPFPESIGGLGIPNLIHSAATAYFMAANGPLAAYSMLTIGNAGLIAHFGTPAQIETFVTPALEGRWTGTMCLSETQAGSSLADIVTKAVPDGQDELGPRYRITGNKMWISGGDHDAADNIVHLVLAKIPGPDGKLIPGTRGISIFIVPKFLPDGTRNDVTLAGLNHKMGYRGTTNCLLNFGEKDGAIGWRVGEAGQGLPIMFQMMNEARIGVGLGATMMGYRGFRLALDYARARPQGRPLGAKDVTAKQVPIIEHADVKRMLLAAKAYSEGSLALILYCSKLVDDAKTAPTPDAREEAEAILGLLTPVAKTWPSEWALAANDIAIQIHGGYGYTRDFDVEQLYRDNRLNPIHEGTTGIQGLDLLGRKILRDGGKIFAQFATRVAITAAAAEQKFPVESKTLAGAMEALQTALRALSTANNEPDMLANATNFLSAFGHTVLGFLWLAIALKIDQTACDEAFAAGKQAAAKYFYAFEMPKIPAWLAPVTARERLTLTMQESWF